MAIVVRATRLDFPKDIAILEVNNALFTNWTTVRVEQRYGQPFPIFQFECSEESPVPLKVDAAQFAPGDIVRVFIGGVPAVFGYITERHVGYDGRQHGVRLVGTGETSDLTNSMVPLEKLNGHDGKSWLQLSRDISAHLNIRITPVGAVDNAPFKNIQIQPGEVIMNVIERYARMRDIVVGSDAMGGLLGLGLDDAVSRGELIEGYNILRANCVIRDDRVYKKYLCIGQADGSDAAHGDSQNKQVASTDGTSTRNRISITLADIADTLHGVRQRVEMEKVFCEGSKIEAQITVQGWFKDNNRSNDVWKAGECYTVTSPSLFLNSKLLACNGCIYEQSDGGGTTTTLQMVKLIHLNKLINFRIGAPQVRD